MKLAPKAEYLLGIVSDTHGLLRPEAMRALSGVDVIIHAGDVGGPEVLPALESIAPVAAVRGNVDLQQWAQALPETAVVEAGGLLLYVVHDLGQLDLDPAAAGIGAVISGHSHRPEITVREGVLFLNPGSIGPRRFRLPVSLALLRARGPLLEPRLLRIDESSPVDISSSPYMKDI